MALETLRGINQIGGFDLTHSELPLNDGLIYCDTPLLIDHSQNTICFKIQNGAIKEFGVNGCQVDTIIETAKLIIEGLNLKFPCEENFDVISHLNCALNYLNDRRLDRLRRGVEGTSNE